MNVNIKIVNLSTNPLPAYQTAHAAGLDLCANLTEPIILYPLGRQLIPTGLFLELPEGIEAQIRPRSGLALKYGITVLNSPGTIDADYRGEIMVLLINFSNEPFIINHGERIAQMVVSQVEQANLVEVMQLASSDRSTGGFGSTGH